MAETMKRSAKKKRITAKDRPEYLPFETTADLLFFNEANEEQYADLVSFQLVYFYLVCVERYLEHGTFSNL